MSDRILFSIGEALIDMIPSRVGCSFDEVPAFSPRVGGAPANVCAAVARLGGRSALLSQLGDDPFGHKIARALAGCGVELSHLEFTGKASTALAFVSLAENGQRTFSFCRKPSADLLYAPEQIDPGWFSQAFALHFCSVSLVDSPMRYAHLAAITAAREAGAILSFDPNLRFPLWPDREQLRQLMEAESYLSASKCVELGLADGLLGEETEPGEPLNLVASVSGNTIRAMRTLPDVRELMRRREEAWPDTAALELEKNRYCGI